MSTDDRLVLNHEQLACLATPIKREIFEALLRIGPASINELAAYLDRSPKSLYYHVRQLCAVGLMRVAETRLAGKRMEAVYALTAGRFEMEDTEDEAYRHVAARSVSALLRQVGREFLAASEAREGKDNITEVVRVVAWLRPEAIATLLDMLRAAAAFVRQNEDPERGVRIGLTLLLSTLESPAERTD